ncbi:YciI family protein [Yeosuana marina]|uniref:YciI family protein n=1 Tax=Yeosuana marina TaxID=1565536 RepID=UPI001421B404|nr:YciI family protein [Yeosuana marina]
MKNTKEFMMLFRYSPDFDYQPSQEEMEAQHQSWGKFIGELAISEKLVSTHQLGFEGMELKADLTYNKGIKISEGQTVGGNLIVKANSETEALEIAKKCPILNMGGTVEIRNTIPMDA